MTEGRLYDFGDFTLDLVGHRLLKGEEEVVLPPKAFDTLLFLVQHAGQLVRKQDLLDAVWPDTSVTENTLSQRIKEIRAALQDEVQEPRYLRTLSRLGYKFIADVVERGHDARPPAGAPELAPAAVAEPRARNYVAWSVGSIALAAVIVAVVATIWRPARPLGPRQRLLSTFPGSHRAARFSPDGNLLAFVSDAAGVPQIWVRPSTGGDAVQVTRGSVAADRPRWTPRNEIVFERTGQGIWSVPALGGEPYPLVPDGHLGDVSRDGQRLAIERGREVWIARADGTGPRRLDGVPARQFQDLPASPTFSPDGRWIALFIQEAGPNGDYWIVPADGGAARRLTFDVREGGPPAWMPDGQSLIVSSTRSGSRTLWRVPVAGGSPEPVTTGAGEDSDPTVSPDGQRIVYTNARHNWALMLRDRAGADRQLLEQRSSIWLAAFSPDGHRLAFFQDVDVEFQIFTINDDGSGLRQITHDAGWHIHPSWSSDAQFVFFYRERPTPFSFRRMPVEGGQSVEVAADWRWPTHMHASVDPPGRRVVYLRQGGPEEDRAFVRDLASGREIALEQPHMHGLKWSRDGGSILGSRHDGTIAVCPADGGHCATVTKGGRAVWSGDGSRIWFARAGDAPGRAAVWSVRLDGHDEQPVGAIGPLPRLNDGFDVSRDDRIAWVQFREGRSELWELARP